MNNQAVEKMVEIAVNEYSAALAEKLVIKYGQRQIRSMLESIGFESFQGIILKSWEHHKANIEKGLCYAVKILEVEILAVSK